MSLLNDAKQLLAALESRAYLYQQIRDFFKQKGVLEVEVPIVGRTTTPDPALHSLTTTVNEQACYLQTSPEFYMKRLLAAGSGDIYYLGKAFRREEQGRLHNPEFTLLEWYRIGFNHHQLMDEVAELLAVVLNTGEFVRFTYQDLFTEFIGINPHMVSISKLNEIAQDKASLSRPLPDKDTLLQLLLTHLIEPQLALMQEPVFIYDFPASQAALAKIRSANPPVAERFEVYFKGIELANGFFELTDATLQKERFIVENNKRKQNKLPEIPLDTALLAALPRMPSCAGVALGVDRLLMLQTAKTHLHELLAFALDTH